MSVARAAGDADSAASEHTDASTPHAINAAAAMQTSNTQLALLLQKLAPPRIFVGPHPSLRSAAASAVKNSAPFGHGGLGNKPIAPAPAPAPAPAHPVHDSAHGTGNSAKKEEGEESTTPGIRAPTWAQYALVDPSRILTAFSDLLDSASRCTGAREESRPSTHINQSGHRDRHLDWPRVVWFGEQHHQPGVLKAQMQLLEALCTREPRHTSQSSQASSSSASSHLDAPIPITSPNISLVLEAFSLKDQPLLDLFQTSHLSISELIALYSRYSKENFHLSHFAPLLLLAKERGVKIWAGFCPRDWAGHVMKTEREVAIADLQRWERQRYMRAVHGLSAPSSSSTTENIELEHSSGSGAASDPSPDLPAEIWSAYHSLPARDRHVVSPLICESTDGRALNPLADISKAQIYTLSHAHKTLLSSLFNPEEPPAWPKAVELTRAQVDAKMPQLGAAEQEAYKARLEQDEQERSEKHAQRGDVELDATLLDPVLQVQQKGFGPAQAVKDTFLAGVVDQILGPLPLSSSLPSSPTNQAQHRASTNVLVIAGSGHLEYSTGAPERLRDLRRARYAAQTPAQAGADKDREEGRRILEGRLRLEEQVERCLLVLSKPNDAGVWGLNLEPQAKDQGSSGPATQTAQTPKDSYREEKGEERAEEKRDERILKSKKLTGWEAIDAWERPLADAVVLYDWVDEE